MKKLRIPYAAPVLGACAWILMAVPIAPAQGLAPGEIQKIQMMIHELDLQLNGGTRKNNERAMATCRAALASPKATLEFFMEATKALEFDEAGKRESDWREWRDQNEDALKSAEHIAALRYQLRYILLCLNYTSASDQKAARKKAMGDLFSYDDDLAQNFSKLESYQRVLRGSVTDSIFGRQLKLDVTLPDSEDLVLSPLPVGRVHERVILTYFREIESYANLQSAWDKRIDHESKTLGAVPEQTMAGRTGGRTGGGAGSRGGGFRLGVGRVDERELEREREREEARQQKEREEEFVRTRLPELRWGKGVDAVLFGTDNSAAYANLGKILRDNLAHKEAQNWLKELKLLAKGGWSAKTYYGTGE